MYQNWEQWLKWSRSSNNHEFNESENREAGEKANLCHHCCCFLFSLNRWLWLSTQCSRPCKFHFFFTSKKHFFYDFFATQHRFTIIFLNSQVGFLFLVTNTFFKLILFVIIICCNFEVSSFIGLKLALPIGFHSICKFDFRGEFCGVGTPLVIVKWSRTKLRF